MKILFLTLAEIDSLDKRGIYTDLMRKFRDEGHQVTIVSPVERRFKQKTQLITQENISILRVKTLNIKKTNVLEKGLGTVLLEFQYSRAIKKFLDNNGFDLILYSTPPITLTSVIQMVKNKTSAKTYLLLKDIFPQNAVDIGMLSKNNPLYLFFRKKEKQLYALTDHIGCMSPANVNYLLKHNPEIPPVIVEVNPNSIELTSSSVTEAEKLQIRKKYNIPEKAAVFVYGGNLGKPQGLDFLTKVIQASKNKNDIFFLVVGSGTEFDRLDGWFKRQNPPNSLLLPGLSKNEYDRLVQACDVGLILLDKRFTIPNFPSRLLSYLEYKMPVLIATDENSDMGKIAEENGFGLFSVHGDLIKFNNQLEKMRANQNMINKMGESGYHYLLNNYTVNHSYEIIMKHFNEKDSQSKTVK